MSEHEEQMKNLFNNIRFDDTPDARHRDALEKQLLGVLAGSGRQPSANAEIWRTIMTSRFVKVAAVMALVAVAGILISRTGTPENPSTVSILASARAAEASLFRSTGVVHIVSEMTLYPGGPDTAKLLKELESSPTYENNVALLKSWISQQWVPLCSLDADGETVWNKIEVTQSGTEPVKVIDAVWYESSSGRFVRTLEMDKHVLFANAYDGQAIYLAQKGADGKLNVVRTPISSKFKVPANPADFMGIAAGVKGPQSTMHFPPIQEATSGTLPDGTKARIYKLGFVDLFGKLDTYFLFRISAETDIMNEIECVVGGKTTRLQKRVAAETVAQPELAWDLANLPKDTPASEGPTARTGKGAWTVSIAEMTEQATFPVYVFATQPSWVKKVQVFNLPDETDPASRMFAVAYVAGDGRDMVLTQTRALTRYFGAMLKGAQGHEDQIPWVYVSTNGFRVIHQKDTQTEMWWTELALKSSGFSPSANRVGYILMAPDSSFLVLAINGPVSDDELHGLVDSLIPAAEYVPQAGQP